MSVGAAREADLWDFCGACLAACRGAPPRAQVPVIEIPPVVGAALLGLDHVNAPPDPDSRLRAYGLPRSL
jgi:hypothetical protein